MDGVAGVCNGCTLLNPTVTAGTWTGSTINNPTFTGTIIFPSTSTFGTISSTSPTTQLVIKNGPSGNIMMAIGGSANDVELRTVLTLPGGAWGSGNLLNNAAPIFQNATFTGTTTSSVAEFGAFLQQTDNSSNTNQNAGVGLYEHLILNGSGVVGGREAGQFTLDINQTTGNTSNQLYTALGTKCNLNATDGGSGTKSSCFGFNPVASVGQNVTAAEVVGAEIDTWIQSGATVTDRIGLQIVDVTGGTFGVQSSRDDVALSLNNQYAPSSTLGFKMGFEFGRTGGQFPVATNGTMIGAQGNAGGAFTVANGIDFHLGTATTNWLRLGSVFTVDGSGNATATSYSGNIGTGNITATGGTTTRTAKDIAGLTNQCYGIKADGTTNDTAALAACRSAATANAVIRLPAGDMNLTSFPTQPSNFVLWQDTGTTYNGSTPITSMGTGTDLVEGMVNGGKWFTRGHTVANMGAELRTDLFVDHTGGTTGFVMGALGTTCTLPATGAPLNNYIWCNQTTMTSSAYGPGEHVVMSASGFRPANALSDGNGPRSQIWAGYFEANDETGAAANLAGSLVGIENDVYANGLDPAGGGSAHRIALQMNVGKSNPAGATAQVIYGVTLGSNDGVSYFGTGYNITAPWSAAAFDASLGTSMSNAPAFRQASGQFFALDAANVHEITYASGALQYQVSGTPVFKVADNGSMTRGVQVSNSIVSFGMSNGFTATVACSTDVEVLNGTGPISSGTLSLCASPADGQFITFITNFTVATLAYSATTVGAPTTITAGTPIKLIYVNASGAWYLTQ